MASCWVPQCTNSKLKNPELIFHYFPPPERLEQRRRWIESCRRFDCQPSLHSRICSWHFPNGWEAGPTRFTWTIEKSSNTNGKDCVGDKGLTKEHPGPIPAAEIEQISKRKVAPKPKMVNCLVKGCRSARYVKKNKRTPEGSEKVSFCRLPSVLQKQGEEEFKRSEYRQKLWLKALSIDTPTQEILLYGRICGRHFVNGHAAPSWNQSSVDWVPTLNLNNNEINITDESKKRTAEADPVSQGKRRKKDLKESDSEGTGNKTRQKKNQTLEVIGECELDEKLIKQFSESPTAIVCLDPDSSVVKSEFGEFSCSKDTSAFSSDESYTLVNAKRKVSKKVPDTSQIKFVTNTVIKCSGNKPKTSEKNISNKTSSNVISMSSVESPLAQPRADVCEQSGLTENFATYSMLKLILNNASATITKPVPLVSILNVAELGNASNQSAVVSESVSLHCTNQTNSLSPPIDDIYNQNDGDSDCFSDQKDIDMIDRTSCTDEQEYSYLPQSVREQNSDDEQMTQSERSADLLMSHNIKSTNQNKRASQPNCGTGKSINEQQSNSEILTDQQQPRKAVEIWKELYEHSDNLNSTNQSKSATQHGTRKTVKASQSYKYINVKSANHQNNQPKKGGKQLFQRMDANLLKEIQAKIDQQFAFQSSVRVMSYSNQSSKSRQDFIAADESPSNLLSSHCASILKYGGHTTSTPNTSNTIQRIKIIRFTPRRTKSSFVSISNFSDIPCPAGPRFLVPASELSVFKSKSNLLKDPEQVDSAEEAQSQMSNNHCESQIFGLCLDSYEILDRRSAELKTDHNYAWRNYSSSNDRCRKEEKVQSVSSCIVCSEKFIGTDLLEHFKESHADLPKFTCPQCIVVFEDRLSLWLHNNARHEKRTCMECLRFFNRSDRTSILNKLRNKLKNNDVEDNVEDNTESSDIMFNIEKHIRARHFNEKIYYCVACNARYARLSNFNEHWKDFHCGRCSTCSAYLDNEPYDKKRFRKCCFKCTKDRRRVVDRARDKISKAKTTVLCPVCGKSFHIRSYLAVHIRTVHEGYRPFKCKECDAAFSLRTNLKFHTESVHLKQKPYSCFLCDASFLVPGQVKRHIAIVHNKEKPNPCSICKKDFLHESGLIKHMKIYHSN